VRHSPAGAAVEISVLDGDAVTQIAVTDSGSGIAPADLDQVFEAGWRGDDARTAGTGNGSHAGAGLGLAITRSIVEAHGGTVTAHNVEGGSRFVLALPHSTEHTAKPGR